MKQKIIDVNNNLSLFINAINEISSIIEGSYGPIGNRSMLIKEGQAPFSTNDGYTILRSLKFEDEISETVKQILLNSANNLNREVGDGTSTSIIITARLLVEFLEIRKKDIEGSYYNEANNLNTIKVIDTILQDIKKKLKKEVNKVTTQEVLEKIAQTACRDNKLAKMIAEFNYKLGKGANIGIVYDTKLETEIFQDSFYVTTLLPDIVFFQDQVNLETKLQKPAVVLVNQEINSNNKNEIINICSKLSDNYKEVIIVSQEQSSDFISYCKKSQTNKGIKVFPLLAPHTGQKTDTVMDDMGVLLDCQPINPRRGDSLSFFTVEKNVGKVKSAVLDKNRVIFEKPQYDKKGLQDRREQVSKLLQDRTMRKESEFLQERERALSLNFGMFYVCGQTDLETTDMYTRIEDAIRACQSAMKNGVLEGGGFPLYRIASDIKHKAIEKGIEYPTKVLARQTGIPEQSFKKKSVDFATGDSHESLVKVGVYDTYDAVIKSLESAFSVLKQVLLTNKVIYEKKEKEDINLMNQ